MEFVRPLDIDPFPPSIYPSLRLNLLIEVHLGGENLANPTKKEREREEKIEAGVKRLSLSLPPSRGEKLSLNKAERQDESVH